jgi:hypothetical protein
MKDQYIDYQVPYNGFKHKGTCIYYEEIVI